MGFLYIISTHSTILRVGGLTRRNGLPGDLVILAFGFYGYLISWGAKERANGNGENGWALGADQQNLAGARNEEEK